MKLSFFRRATLASLSLFFIAYSAHATEPIFEWAYSIGSSGQDRGKKIATDKEGNLYIAGGYSGTVDFDPGEKSYTLTSVGGNNTFIMKLDAHKNLVWAKSFEKDFGDISISVDLNGDIFLTGSFLGTGTYDLDPGEESYLVNSKGNDIFITKLNNEGNFQWAHLIPTDVSITSSPSPNLAIDQTGNVYIVDNFSNTVDFDPTSGINELTAEGSINIFILKLNSYGIFQWVKSIKGNVSCESITTDTTNNIFITGSFNNTVDFDPGDEIKQLTSTGSDIFVLKINLNGVYQWAKQIGGNSSGSGSSICRDYEGNLYITGYFDGSGDFDPGTDSYILTSKNEAPDIFIMKLDINGNFIWAKSIGGNSFDEGEHIITDIYGNAYTIGYFSDTIYYNDKQLISMGGYDVFVVKYNPKGDMQWITSFGNDTYIYRYHITSDKEGDVFITGKYSNTLYYNQDKETKELISVGNDDMFLFKIAPCKLTIDTHQLWFGKQNAYKKITIQSNDTYAINTASDWITASLKDNVVTIFVDELTAANGRIGYVAVEGCITDSIKVIQTGTATNITSCQPVVWNNTTYTIPGIYTKTLTDSKGNDSLATLILTNTLDLSYTQVGNTYIAKADNMEKYWWYNAATSEVLSSTQSFTPKDNGKYILAIVHNGCNGRSDTITVGTLDINENLLNGKISIYPNPTTGMLNIDFENDQQQARVNIRSITGRLIQQETVTNVRSVNFEIKAEKGFYFVEVITGQGQMVAKVLVL